MRKQVLLFAFIVFCIFNYSMAGNLNPTSMPSSDGTMKTLNEVEPRIAINSKNTPGDADYEYIIDAPGSYYLTGNVITTKSGIRIASSNVTVDFCGYMLEYSGTIYKTGVYISDSNDVEIHNGSINNFNSGVYNPANDNHNNRVISVNITNSRIYGVNLYGDSNVIKNCVIRGNGNTGLSAAACGIKTGDQSIVKGNHISNNCHNCPYHAYAIRTGESCIVADNIVCNNGHNVSNNFYAIYVDRASIVSGNICKDNAKDATGSDKNLYGIYATNFGQVIKDNAVYSTGYGAEGSAWGIMASDVCVVSNNTSFNNKTDNMYMGSYCVDDNNCAP